LRLFLIAVVAVAWFHDLVIPVTEGAAARSQTMKATRSVRYVSRLTQGTLALILAGGRGERLKNLTLDRAKPATPFGGKYRIIDFPLSNCVNSGIRQICVLTQYKAHDLILHIQKGWGYLRGEFGEFVEMLPAQQQLGERWYAGTADAVYQNLDIIEGHAPEHVLILAGDHIYKMDYGPMVAAHVEQDADITVGCVEVPVERAKEFGVVTIDAEQRISKFTEKPSRPDTLADRPHLTLASMGIYVISLPFLREVLERDQQSGASQHDFGRNIIPGIIASHRVYAFKFEDTATGAQRYWRDVGNVDAFYEANMELVHVSPELNLYDERWPIWTYQEQRPPAKFILDEEGRRGLAINSMVSAGCIISGGIVRQSLLFSNVRIDEGSRVEETVVLPHVRIGRGCRIRRAVLDEECNIPDGMVIGDDPQLDGKRFYVTNKGVVLVTAEMVRAVLREA
jgi:glucose-1-phosphate adenylyltransferase